MDVTTVADDLIVTHDGFQVHRLEGLQPDTDHVVSDTVIRTLPRPGGALLCRFATANDVHFGEEEAGRLGEAPGGPVQRVEPGEPPYPETMNRAAVAEMVGIDPAAVIVKGDLSADGQRAEWDAFEQCYRDVFGDRLFAVRGNHDAYQGQSAYADDQWIAMPGVSVALLDTTIPTKTTGWLTTEQLDWLEAHAQASTVPIIAMGHHQQFTGTNRTPDYFGLHPDASDALTAVIERCPALVAYTAGHTHRHRRRLLPNGVPTIEVGCVKDFPGSWAEYRVYEDGITQVVHRVSSPAALRWSERCRHLYQDYGVDYESYALGSLSDRCFNIALR